MSSPVQRRALPTLLPAVLISLVLLPLLSMAKPVGETGKGVPEVSGSNLSAVYIIRLDEPSVLEYLVDGSDTRSADRKRQGHKRLDFLPPEAMDHLSRIREQHKEFQFRAQKSLARKLEPRYTYSHAFNGLAVTLDPREAGDIARLPGVVQVWPEVLRFPLTNAGPAWIGAPGVWDGAGLGTRGEGVVVGILDTGIHPEHPSFAEMDGDGYVHANPKGRFFGVCDADNNDYDPAFPCNNKLIGAWSFVNKTLDPSSPRDSHGHGTHVAATAAGNALQTDLANPAQFGVSLSGVAHRANIIVYDVCVVGCSESAALAGIDQAVADGVDVINFSIGGPAFNQWSDPVSLALLAARDAGIFTAVAAGNSGPLHQSVLSPANAPWVTAVGAVTHDRSFGDQELELTGPGAPPPMKGPGITRAYGPAPLVYASDHGDALCRDPFPAGTWLNGEIVICDRGLIARVEKGANVKAGGAGGMVLVNQAPDLDLVADFHVLPAIHLSFDDGDTLKTLLASAGGGILGELLGTERVLDPSSGDITASFSSRGPNRPAPGVLKPDLTAPGVQVLAAGLPLQNENATFSTISGTSMSAPHAAGAAALLMSLHPAWSPDMIRSALMTTAETSGLLKEDGLSAANPFDRGAGRISLGEAARAGLTLQESTSNFLAADPASGGDPRTLNLPSLVDDNCQGTCSWQRTLDSTLAGFSAWSVSQSSPSGLSLAVSPSIFTLPPGESVTLLVEADVRGLPVNEWSFGEVVLSSPDSTDIRLQVAALVKPGPEVPPGGGGGCMIASVHPGSESGLYPAGVMILAILLLTLAFAARSRRSSTESYRSSPSPCGASRPLRHIAQLAAKIGSTCSKGIGP